nr:helix-hairpin-helix domain-containing protein [Acidobacteriota bacterium]
MQLPLERDAPSASASGPATVLEGVLERIVFANEENAWSVVRLAVQGRREPVTAVGNLLGVQPGESLRLHGSWTLDPRHGRQFRVSSYSTVVPATVSGIEKYLGSGLIRGISKVMAGRLVASFGLDTLTVIESQPDRLREVNGIGPKRTAEILRAWQEQREIKDVMIFLQSHGVSTHYAIKIYKSYGPRATALVRENPYRLAADIHGIGFKSADKIAAALGISPQAPQRVEAGTLYLLGMAADRGHLYLPHSELLTTAQELLGVPAERVSAAVTALGEAAQVRVETLAGRDEQAVFLPALHAAEAGAAARVRALLAQPPLPLEIDFDRALEW